MSAMGDFYIRFQEAFQTETHFTQFDDPAMEEACMDAAGLLINGGTPAERITKAAQAAAQLDFPVFDGIVCLARRKTIARRILEEFWSQTFDPATA